MIKDILLLATVIALTVMAAMQAHNIVTQTNKHKQYLACMKAHVHMIISDETFDYWDSYCMAQVSNK